MFQEFLSQSPLIIWPLIAFVLFFAVFLGVCVYLVIGAIRKQDLSHLASLPLDDDPPAVADRGEPLS